MLKTSAHVAPRLTPKCQAGCRSRSALLSLDLSNERQQAATRLMKEGEPLLQSVRVLVNHVGRAREGDAATLELLLRRVDVLHAEVQDGVVVKVRHFDNRPILDHQADTP